MSWLQSLTGALGGSSNPGASQGPTNQGGNSNGGTVPTTFDNTGNPVSAGNSNRSPSPDSSGQGKGEPQNSGGSSQKTPTVEELLFSAPEPKQSNQSNQSNQQAEPKPQNPNEIELAPGLTSARLVQNLQGVNFMGTIPKETLQSAMSGDAEAFGSVLSSVAQMSAAIAIQQSLSANKASLDARFTEYDTKVKSTIGETKYSDILADPKFGSPFVKPLAENLISRLRERDPAITPDQIKQVLPNLIQHAMSQYSANSTISSTPTSQGNQRVQAKEVNIDELFG